MPVGKHYQGKGEEVMEDMKDRYGDEAGERTFYATENKQQKKKGRSARAAAVKKMAMARRR